MKKWIFGIIIVSLLAVTQIGCNEEQLTKTDKLISDINNVATGAGAVLESPAGDLVPDQVKIFAALAIALASGGVNIYQKWRSGIMTKTTKAIVRGIEQTTPAGNPDQDNNYINGLVKKNIEAQMKKAGIYDRGNKIVDNLKGVL